MTMSALEMIADRNLTATNAAERYRDTFRNEKTVRAAEAKGYAEGRASAYNDAHQIMKAELESLRNLWQNGGLSYDSFKV